MSDFLTLAGNETDQDFRSKNIILSGVGEAVSGVANLFLVQVWRPAQTNSNLIKPLTRLRQFTATVSRESPGRLLAQVDSRRSQTLVSPTAAHLGPYPDSPPVVVLLKGYAEVWTVVREVERDVDRLIDI